MERLRIPMLGLTAILLSVSLYYAFVRRPTMRNKVVAFTSVAVAVAATAYGWSRG